MTKSTHGPPRQRPIWMQVSVKTKAFTELEAFHYGMGANIEMYLGYQTVNGYNPLFLSRYYQYINYYRFYKKPVPEGWIVFFYDIFENGVLMDLLNVKYEISHTYENLCPSGILSAESIHRSREQDHGWEKYS